MIHTWAEVCGIAAVLGAFQWFIVRLSVKSAMYDVLKEYVTQRECDVRHEEK